VVLDAEGINAFAAVKAGLRKDFTMENAALAVKEVHALPARLSTSVSTSATTKGHYSVDRRVRARHDG
jgi:flavin-dependent dehydrogenase